MTFEKIFGFCPKFLSFLCGIIDLQEFLMSFEQLYDEIKKTVQSDIDFLENQIGDLFSSKSPLDVELRKVLTAPAKRLRPLLGYLFIRSVSSDVSPSQRDVLLATELIHNASLIHDDVMDKSDKRRGIDTLNSKFDDNLAVIAGDFLLSVSMEKVIDTNSVEVIKLFVNAMKSTCLGEITQYFSKFEVPSIDEYIEKSLYKTAFLFQIGILSSLYLSEHKSNDKLKSVAEEFSKNFGLAFQIRDDLKNVLECGNDFQSGIYTAPVVFAAQENPNILKEENILEAVKARKGIEKTRDLMDNYFDKAVEAIKEIENNLYKQAILKLVEALRVSI